jgi:hypothetical protein
MWTPVDSSPQAEFADSGGKGVSQDILVYQVEP